MKSVAVIGSGLSAAGACLSLAKKSLDIHVFDVGEELDAPNNSSLKNLGSSPPSDWIHNDIRLVTKNPSMTLFKMPQKLVFGSDYIYLNTRALMNFKSNKQPITPTFAKGGFSRGWGGAALPISKKELKDWPINFDDLKPHYEEIWNQVPISGIENPKYEKEFPIFGNYSSSLILPQPCQKLFDIIQRDKNYQNYNNFIISQSRLMVKGGAEGCINCGICIAGCPYGFIFQADTIIEKLKKQKVLKYHPFSFVEFIDEKKSGVTLTIADTRSRKRSNKKFDKILVACGAIGTTALMQRSKIVDDKVKIYNSDKFIFPMFLKTNPGILHDQSPSLPGLFASIKIPYKGNYFYSHGQISSISSFLNLKWHMFSKFMPWPILNRILFMQGSLPSNLSSRTIIKMKNSKTVISEMIPINNIDNILLMTINEYKKSPLSKAVIIIPKIHKYLPAGGHHYGGQFPMKKNPSTNQTDVLGRINKISSIHIIDASTFPNIPSSTVGFTLMANAHRITESAFK